MTRSSVLRALLAITMVVAFPGPLSAQGQEGASGVSRESYRRARAVVERAFEAFGGRERLEAARDLAIDIEGELSFAPLRA